MNSGIFSVLVYFLVELLFLFREASLKEVRTGNAIQFMYTLRLPNVHAVCYSATFIDYDVDVFIKDVCHIHHLFS